MEASQAGIIINNSNNIVLTANQVVGLAGGSGILGIILTIALKIGDGFIKEFFIKREHSRSKRLEAAKDINAFCIEGMKVGFRHKPRSEEHILFRATEIEAIDHEVGVKLRVFLRSWMQYRDFLIENQNEVERERMAIGFKNDAQRYGDELLKISRTWAK